MKNDQLSRRRFISTGALAATGMVFLSRASFANSVLNIADKPNSKINGVQIGVITYSFRSLPGSIEDMLKDTLACNISAIELMGDAAEDYAGKPKHASAQEVAQWRATVSMDKFKEIRKMFNDAGVSIYAWKPSALEEHNTDEEIAYAFKAGKALGASHCTVELPNDKQTQRLGDIAEKNGMKVGYHAHSQATPILWDKALEQSKANGINLDAGHYTAGTSGSPIPFIEKNHDRILSMHLKDRKYHDGPNEPWGQGDTPIKDILQTIKKNKYKFPVTIEYEYNTPAGSDAIAEVKKCRDFAEAALKA